MHLSLPYMDSIPRFINSTFKNNEPWQIVTMTTTATLAVVWLWNFIYQDESK